MNKTEKHNYETGETTSINWMLDETIEVFDEMGMNTPAMEKLIKKLAIQKIEYGRTCFAQTTVKGGRTIETIVQLGKLIKGLGEEPKEVIIPF